MKWEADQRNGWFGWTPKRGAIAPQPLYRERIDIAAALASADAVLSLWFRARRLPEVPAFAGGLLDGWPAWAVEAFGICRQEEANVTAYMMGEAHG